MSQPDNDPVATLLQSYLSRPNALTKAQYEAAIDDFARFAGAEDRRVAIRGLLEGDFASAAKRVTEYLQDMIGTYDKEGHLIGGRGLSAAAINLRLTVLRGILKLARRTGTINWELDVRNVPSEAVHDASGPGLGILNRMLEAARKTPGPEGRRNYAILRLAGELGLRRKEIVGLSLGDFDAIEGTVSIKGKGRRQHEKLSCTSETVDALIRWIEVRPRPRVGSPLFTNLIPGRASQLTGDAVWRIVRTLGKQALPPGSRKTVRPHGIRHTAITEAVRRAAQAGVAREDVKQFSRHKDFRMVARYIDAHEGAQKRLGAAIGQALK